METKDIVDCLADLQAVALYGKKKERKAATKDLADWAYFAEKELDTAYKEMKDLERRIAGLRLDRELLQEAICKAAINRWPSANSGPGGVNEPETRNEVDKGPDPSHLATEVGSSGRSCVIDEHAHGDDAQLIAFDAAIVKAMNEWVHTDPSVDAKIKAQVPADTPMPAPNEPCYDGWRRNTRPAI